MKWIMLASILALASCGEETKKAAEGEIANEVYDRTDEPIRVELKKALQELEGAWIDVRDFIRNLASKLTSEEQVEFAEYLRR